MNRKASFYGIIFLALSIIGYLGVRTYRIQESKSKALLKVSQLPDLGQYFDSSIQLTGKAVIVNYFHPDCEHCEYMIKKIIENKEKLKLKKLLMISPASKPTINEFVNKYRLDSFPFIHISRDSSLNFAKVFGSDFLPSFYIYDAEHNLDTIINGETKIANLLK